MPPTYVISLPGSARRSRLQSTFDSIGLPFEFWDAVNGAELSAQALAEVDQEHAQRDWGHRLNKGEIGCALSHIGLYEHMLKQGIGEAIILEDDAQPAEGFLETLAHMLSSLPQRAEIAFLHHGKAKSWPLKRSLPHKHKLVRYRYPSANSRRGIFSARGYWLSLEAAKKLLALAYPIRMPADCLTGYIQRNRLNAYGVEPNLLLETDLPSEIDDGQVRPWLK
ncbi:LPS biosynthesis glycosyltransferase [Billgrantia endophytica]|uniref:LPS biosynthesis glycosyltransferase n=1 Tax=Billgrantia endophytica TaxID=2033802 RepID=A0A2N7TY41_9GAMM|nr:LPS biosynthesis glycosyltransferase [Halomonas endophytica]